VSAFAHHALRRDDSQVAIDTGTSSCADRAAGIPGWSASNWGAAYLRPLHALRRNFSKNTRSSLKKNGTTEHPANGSFRHEPKEIWSSLTAD